MFAANLYFHAERRGIRMKSAPFSCPKCGTEKEWRCLNDPTVNIQMENGHPIAGAAVASILPIIGFFFGLLQIFMGLGIRLKQLWNKLFLVYKCEKCGYKGFFRADKKKRGTISSSAELRF